MVKPRTSEEKKLATFSHDIWGEKTTQYLLSIATLEDVEWDEIIFHADACRGKAIGMGDTVKDEREDDRANIF